ncbi:hypothetical protein GGF32_005852 [Allomyces javanicus]|nr:hypothetical protein GGF32_005852 [Allomyces javanicus]
MNLSVHSTRWAVFIISMLTALAGIVLIVLGIYTLNDTTTTLGSRTIPVMMLVLGCLIFLVSFLGAFGTISENHAILYAFMIGLLALVGIQIVIAVIALANKGAVDSLMDEAWQKAYDEHPRVLRDVQEEYGCCGFRYTTDRAIPKSTPDACLKSVEFGYQVSCYRALIGGYKNIQTIVGAAGIILSAIQLIGVFLTYLLIRNLPAKDEQHEQHRYLHPEQRRLLDPNYHPDRYYYYGGVPPPGATPYGAGGYYAGGPAYPAGTSAGGPTGAGAGAGNVPTGSLKDPKVTVETETTGLGGGTATEGTVSPTGVTSDTTF